MGEFSFENQGTQTYLVYTIPESAKIDSMSMGMLANNRIPGLAPAMFTQMDTSKYIKYNVSARISASQLFQGNVNKKRLVGVFSGIVDAMLSAEDYMIDPSSILLQLDYIFVDVSTCDTVLICLPILGTNSQQLNLGAFFKGIMFSTQFDQTENCDYVAKIINYLNSAPTFSLPDFKQVLDGIKGSPNRQTAQPQPQQSSPAQRVQQPAPAMTPQQSVQQPQIQRPAVQQAQAQPYYQQPQQAQPMRSAPPVQAMPTQPPQQPKRSAQPQMQVPQAPAPQSMPSTPVQAGAQEDSISLFYLLQHYNKDNVARYKAQKEAKKKQADMPSAVPQGKPKKEKKKKETAQPSFTVPGAPQGPSFAIPGQAASISSGYTPTPQPQSVQPQSVQQQAVQRTQQQNYPAKSAPIQQPAYQTQTAPTYQSQTMPQYAQPQTTPMNFGETTVLGGGTTIGETTVLGDGAQNVQLRPHLIRLKNNERIDISKPVFRIGKERSYVDYFIGDNTAVSRSHANIVSRNGEYFIVDTNSTNHTYVNGGMILSNSETKISHGTKIRLANEEFEFRLY